MATLIQWIKLKALASALDSLSTKDIATVIEKFGRAEFGEDGLKDYLLQMRMKLASLTVELGKRG